LLTAVLLLLNVAAVGEVATVEEGLEVPAGQAVVPAV